MYETRPNGSTPASGYPPIQHVNAALAADEGRNDIIFDDVLRALETGRSPILLTERKDPMLTVLRSGSAVSPGTCSYSAVAWEPASAAR